MRTNSIGYMDIPVPEGVDLKAEIDRMRKEKNAVILAHYYQTADIQDIADYVGDSLALAQWAERTEANILVLCGVHFMGETAKILCPEKKVLVPDLNAGCSLADSCPAPEFERFIQARPGHTVISYVNTTAAVKTLTDIVVTSTNARKIIESLPADEKIIFGPDRNLGSYINRTTGRQMLLWEGACHVHERFSAERIKALKAEHPEALVIAHPECPKEVVEQADYVGSTAGLLKYATQSANATFIVATENGVLHEMRKRNPHKTFIPAPNDLEGACGECHYMRMNTMGKLYNCLKYELPEIHVDEAIRQKAIRPIQRMLELSKQLGL